MRNIYLCFCIAFLSFVITSVKAQVSRIVYAQDSLSGELQVREADCKQPQELVWSINLPANKMVQVTRVNNSFFQIINNKSGVDILVDAVNPILDYQNVGTFRDTLTNAGTITIILNQPKCQVYKDPLFTIRFAVIDDATHSSSSSTAFGGNVDVFNGMLNVTGSQSYMGQNVSAVLGGNYSDYTCFGSPQGGRIRGSNDGYLILEGNPNGYGNKNVYINRYVAGGNILMTSSTGKVGIGTDNPQEKLHIGGYIRGNGLAGSLVVSTEYGKLTMGAQDTSSVTFSTDRHLFRFTEDVRLDKGLSARNKLELYRSIPNSPNSTYVNIKLDTGGDCFFLNNGNIGIETNAPQYKLDVNGTMRAKKILVNTENGADFVFEDDYRLRPLNEVKSFIQENGHLPEIQSANDMKENGVSVNDFQIQLLQKIEELTLYILQQDEQIQSLRQEIDNLKK